MGSENGTLYQVTTPLATPATVASGTIAAGLGIVDSPVVDTTPTTPVVYTFVGDDTALHSAVYQFTDTFAATTTGIEESMGTGTGSTTLTVYDGDFDNVHYGGSGATGNLYFCGGSSATAANPTLYEIPINSGFSGTVATISNLTSGAATCSPATEFYNTGSGGTALTTTSSALTTTTTTSTNAISAIGSPTVFDVGSTTNIAVGDYLQIDSEDMVVTVKTTCGGFPCVTATRAQLGTTEAAHIRRSDCNHFPKYHRYGRCHPRVRLSRTATISRLARRSWTSPPGGGATA